MPSSGLHERKPSELAHPAAPLDFDEESSSSSNTTGTDTFAAQAIRRVQNLVQVQQKWWKNERRSLTRTTAPGTPGGRSSRRDVAPLAKRLGDFLSIFYVTEDPRGGCTPSSGGTIPLPSTSGFPTPSPLLASTTRISPYPRTTKRPPALSRKGWLAVALLFLLGLRELVVLSRPGGGRREVKIRGRDPLATVAELKATERNGKGRGKGRPLPGTERLWKLKPASATPSPIAGEGLERWADEEVEGDTTAIVLHWKRTDNVKVIVADLCQYSFFQTVFIWNNNPDIHLTRQHFASTLCPPARLRIYNSPRNMLFISRYLACAQSTTPYCFFQDDDWLVRPLRSIYAQFRRDPEGPVVVSTNSEVATLYGLEWCFFQTPLHSCFSWVGTGAFSAKSHVTRFLSTISDIGYASDEVAHADNSFTLFQNEPPYVLSGDLIQLPSPYGHSDGEGIKRNKDFIQQALVHFTDYLSTHSPPSSPLNRITTLLHTPLPISSTPYLTAPSPPLAPHPYSHHTRSPCQIYDTCNFLTNIPLLPLPDAIPYPGPEHVGLEQWENHLGAIARGWMEGGGVGEVWVEEEMWAKKWPYEAAVDGREGTAFRSPDVIHAQDYIALDLLQALQVDALPRGAVEFLFTLEEVEQVLSAIVFEVSTDGYRWFPPNNAPLPSAICTATSHRSTLPSPSFPLSSLSSPTALALRSTQALAESSSSILSRLWGTRRKFLKECRVVLGARYLEEEGDVQGPETEGWRFVRMKAEEGRNVGWGVYDLRVEPASL